MGREELQAIRLPLLNLYSKWAHAMLKELAATKPPTYRSQNSLHSGLPDGLGMGRGDNLGANSRSLWDSFSKRGIFTQLRIGLLIGQLPKIFHN